MFSPLGRRRDGTKEISVPRRDTTTIEDPIEEFNYLLDRLNCLIGISKEDFFELKETPSEKASLPFFRRPRKRDSDVEEKGDGESNDDAKNTGPGTSTPIPQTPPPLRPSRTSKNSAIFIPIAEEEECVEIIRRISELVIIGERVVATQMEKEDKLKQHRQKKGWGASITDDDDIVNEQAEPELEPGSEAYIGIFDLFFERNGLGTIVDILTGDLFKPNPLSDTADNNANTGENANAEDTAVEETKTNQETTDEDKALGEVEDETENTRGVHSSEFDNDEVLGESNGDALLPNQNSEESANVHHKVLPPLSIATQSVQSVSILVQNVSRATSLYFVLSNNYINALIDLPLDLYTAAEKNRVAGNTNTQALRNKHFTTPELQELTTHFVTFLKSLALRMNTETLQFYLKYPAYTPDDGDNASEETKARAIEFPLYARALDFCAAHHDSFVRVTAMNICLNTLRLTTVVPVEGDADDSKAKKVGSSPDGVLHHARPLPFRERLAIATHTCAPSRVERLASPIFTKLNSLWCQLQEKFLYLDSWQDEEDDRPKQVAPMDSAKERERRHNAFKDVAATLQDQLLLLDDLFKVGLTALNEQIIEMMLATFVYPLLLQPLLVYYQRLPFDSGEAPPLLDPFARRGLTVDFNEVGRVPPEVSAPAKTALFTLAGVFHLISNRPLLRLLFCALFHPLSPDSSGETVISAEGCVTRLDENGNKVIRVDDPSSKSNSERISYPFGGKEQAPSLIDHEAAENCVFVLSPALAEVLKVGGGDYQPPPTNTRKNPYRRAILQMLEVPHHMSDFRKLSFHTVDAAVSNFDGTFIVDTLLGRGVLSSKADLADCLQEVVAALCEGLVNGVPGPFGTWKLQFDSTAAHAMLCVTLKCPEALDLAAKIVGERYWKAASLVASIPGRIPTTQHLGSIMNLVFYEAASKRRKATFSDLYYLKNTDPLRFSTGIASSSTFRSLCDRSFEAPPTPVLLNKFNEHTAMDLGSSSCRAMLKLDALNTFLKATSREPSLIADVNPFGFALTSDRGIVETKECFVDDLTRSIHSYLSPGFCKALTGGFDVSSSQRPMPGSIVALVGRTAMPCVCEAPPSATASANGSKLVVEGVIWQSLYLVFFGTYLVLAEPAVGSPGNGRVVTSCVLSRITVARDPNPPADPSSPARRLLMAYKWFDTEAPGLFVYDEEPKVEEVGPFNRVRLWRSKLDVWFEDEGAAAHAYHSIHFQIDKAKTLRGDSILDYLAQHEEGS